MIDPNVKGAISEFFDKSHMSETIDVPAGWENTVDEEHSLLLHFGSTNPCRIIRKVEQTKMYVCTLEEFILVDIWIHCCASWN